MLSNGIFRGSLPFSTDRSLLFHSRGGVEPPGGRQRPQSQGKRGFPVDALADAPPDHGPALTGDGQKACHNCILTGGPNGMGPRRAPLTGAGRHGVMEEKRHEPSESRS
ncbi:protein of unknown function [Cyanobium sp. NIES-981]|nr:protein of unknown function [Cyanobium sp. NIES-981]